MAPDAQNVSLLQAVIREDFTQFYDQTKHHNTKSGNLKCSRKGLKLASSKNVT